VNGRSRKGPASSKAGEQKDTERSQDELEREGGKEVAHRDAMRLVNTSLAVPSTPPWP